MDADRESSRLGFSRPRESGGAYHNQTHAEVIFLGAGGEPRNGVSHQRKPRAAPPVFRGNGTSPPSIEVEPPELRALLRANEASMRDAAWDAFAAKYSRLLLHVARSELPTREDAMDAYAHLLERLRRENCRALTGYTPDGRSRFSTWLVVVSKRMCVDFYRRKYGRPRGSTVTASAEAERMARLRLIDFAMSGTELAQIPDDHNGGPDASLRVEQLNTALKTAVGRLAPEDRLLLKLRFHDELPAQRIAEFTGMRSPFHVYRRLNAVCQMLKAYLAANGVEGSAP